MAVPNGHLVAFCTDLGIAPAQGAAMLSVLLACAFLSRQFWGMLADRIGGLHAVMVGSACQAVAIGAFLLPRTRSACLPSPPPSASASPASSHPMSWRSANSSPPPKHPGACRDFLSRYVRHGVRQLVAGALYDHFGFYAPAFAVGVFFNIANLIVISFLVSRRRAQRLVFA